MNTPTTNNGNAGKGGTTGASEVGPNEVILSVPLTAILADFDWNVRSHADLINEHSDGVQDTAGERRELQGTGLTGLATSMREQGQDTPVILRPIPKDGKTLGGKKAAPEHKFELVCGFRRFVAATKLNDAEHLANATKLGQTTIKNTPNGTIRAVVRDLTAPEARMLNGRENTARANLRTQDMLKLCMSLRKDGFTQQAISDGLNITQGYVSKLLSIATLPTAILDHWREGKLPPGAPPTMATAQMTTNGLADLAKVSEGQAPHDVIARYIETLAPSTPAPGTGKEDPAVKRVTETAKLVAALVRAGFVQPGHLQWYKVIGPKGLIDSKTKDHGRILALVDIASKAYEAELARNVTAPVSGVESEDN